MKDLTMQIFIGLFLLMSGTLIGNSMHGKQISQISHDVAIIKTTVQIYHPVGIVSNGEEADTLLAMSQGN